MDQIAPIQRALFKSPVGFICLEGTPQGVHRVSFLKKKPHWEEQNKPKGAIEDALIWLQGFFLSKEKGSFPWRDINLTGGTPFEKKVWYQLWKVPYGGLESYGSLAKKVGVPGAARALGNALNKNPLPLLIPCHRVISADGSIGGFSAGLSIKKKLLEGEGSWSQGV